MSEKGSIGGFDFHCHIDLLPDPVAVIDRCARDGIVTLAVTTTPKAWRRIVTGPYGPVM